MVLISRADDNLKALSKNKWQPDPHHPDVDPLNEAVKLASVFERALALEEVNAQPADFRQWMEDSRVESAALRTAVEALRQGSGTVEEADAAYKTLTKTCTACHEAYRN
jgi:cytochrome c556